MDTLTGLPLPLALVLLALIDGLSVGTLLLPLFFLLAPGRPRVARIMLYLATITLFYLLVGVLFMTGLVNVVDFGRDFIASPAGQGTLLVVGLAMLAAGILIGVADSQKKKAARAVAAGGGADGGPAPAAPQPGRLVRWRDRLLADRASNRAIMGVALAAGLIEVVSMLPYLIGMTLLAEASITMPARYAMLAGYCLVMILPALVLLVARVVAAGLVERPLQRLADWLQRTGSENTSWLLGIVGFLIARGAAAQLGLDLPIIG